MLSGYLVFPPPAGRRGLYKNEVTDRVAAEGGPAQRRLHPVVWMILVLPFGIAVGYLQVAVPYVLRLRGLEMGVIGALSFAANQPHSFKVLWAPLLDIGWPRRNWYVLTVVLTAAALALTSFIPPDAGRSFGPVTFLTLYTLALTAAQAAVATSSSAVLGMMATVLPDADKARASGWQTCGNLAGTAMGGAAVAWLVEHTSQGVTAAILAAACLACMLPVLWITEPPSEKRPLGGAVVALLKDLWGSIVSRSGWTGILISLSPVGAGGMVNLFSALATDYSTDPATTEQMVVYATGLLGGLVSAAGALVGGYVCERMNSRLAYVVFGFVTALAAVAMIVGPATPATFVAGSLAYSFFNGISFTAFYAFVFDMIGKGPGAATKLALFISASNQASTYVTWLDGKGYDWAKAWLAPRPWAGRAGMLGMDAGSTFAGIALLGAMLLLVRKLGAERPAEVAA